MNKCSYVNINIAPIQPLVNRYYEKIWIYFCVVNRYEPLFLKKEEKKWYNSDVSLETEP